VKDHILVLGDINMDALMQTPGLPPAGGGVVAQGMSLRAGGSAANTAVVLAKLGAAVDLLGCVGQDAHADAAMAALAGAGVNLRHVQRTEAPTGFIFIAVTPDGERTMFSFRGANVLLAAQDIPADIWQGAALLHLSGFAFLDDPQRAAAWRAVGLADAAHTPVCLDTALEPALLQPEELKKLLPHLKICITGMQEAHALLGVETPQAAADALLQAGVSLAAVKLGAAGCLLANKSEQQLCAGLPVQAVDSTGAGDAFSAGLLLAHSRKIKLSAAGLLANAMGALATTVHGGGAALPGKSEAEAFLRGLAGVDETDRNKVLQALDE
jgi:ribokinase